MLSKIADSIIMHCLRLITINGNCIVLKRLFATSACSQWPRGAKENEAFSHSSSGVEKWRQFLKTKRNVLNEGNNDKENVSNTAFGSIRMDSMNEQDDPYKSHVISARQVPIDSRRNDER